MPAETTEQTFTYVITSAPRSYDYGTPPTARIFIFEEERGNLPKDLPWDGLRVVALDPARAADQMARYQSGLYIVCPAADFAAQWGTGEWSVSNTFSCVITDADIAAAHEVVEAKRPVKAVRRTSGRTSRVEVAYADGSKKKLHKEFGPATHIVVITRLRGAYGPEMPGCPSRHGHDKRTVLEPCYGTASVEDVAACRAKADAHAEPGTDMTNGEQRTVYISEPVAIEGPEWTPEFSVAEEQAAMACIRTSSLDEFKKVLAEERMPEVGKLALFHACGQWRQGVIIGLGKKNIEIFYATPSNATQCRAKNVKPGKYAVIK